MCGWLVDTIFNPVVVKKLIIDGVWMGLENILAADSQIQADHSILL
jgi:hypothetical protein